MARVGITLENVKQAKEAILARGESISIDTVRAELGHTGSKSTIHKHLKRLAGNDENAPTEMYLSGELQQLLNHVAARLKKEAYASLKEKTDAFEQIIHDKDDRIAALNEQNSELIAHREKLHDEFEAAADENKTLNARIKTQDQDIVLKLQQISALEQQIAIAGKHNASLEAKHQDARQSLSHYRESMAQQREQESAKHEQECSQLRQACHATTQTLTAKQVAYDEAQEEIKSIKQALAVVSNELETTRNASIGHQEQARLLQQKIDALTQNIATLQAEKLHARGRWNELDAVNRELRQDNDTLREAKSRLEGQYQAQQSLIDKFAHLNRETPGGQDQSANDDPT